MAKEKLRDAKRGNGRGRSVGMKREVVEASGFDGEDGEDHGVGVVDVEHETGDQGESQPLRKRAGGKRLVPIPEEEGHDESGMRMRPGGIEIHVDGERAGAPDGESGKKGPALFDILAREAEGKKQSEKCVERGGKSHGDAVRSGKTVGGDGGT